jgi:hypothetical protein
MKERPVAALDVFADRAMGGDYMDTTAAVREVLRRPGGLSVALTSKHARRSHRTDTKDCQSSGRSTMSTFLFPENRTAFIIEFFLDPWLCNTVRIESRNA